MLAVPELEESALTAVKQWDYEPVLVEGTPIRRLIRQTVRYNEPAPASGSPAEFEKLLIHLPSTRGPRSSCGPLNCTTLLPTTPWLLSGRSPSARLVRRATAKARRSVFDVLDADACDHSSAGRTHPHECKLLHAVPTGRFTDIHVPLRINSQRVRDEELPAPAASSAK